MDNKKEDDAKKKEQKVPSKELLGKKEESKGTHVDKGEKAQTVPEIENVKKEQKDQKLDADTQKPKDETVVSERKASNDQKLDSEKKELKDQKADSEKKELKEQSGEGKKKELKEQIENNDSSQTPASGKKRQKRKTKKNEKLQSPRMEDKPKTTTDLTDSESDEAVKKSTTVQRPKDTKSSKSSSSSSSRRKRLLSRKERDARRVNVEKLNQSGKSILEYKKTVQARKDKERSESVTTMNSNEETLGVIKNLKLPNKSETEKSGEPQKADSPAKDQRPETKTVLTNVCAQPNPASAGNTTVEEQSVMQTLTTRTEMCAWPPDDPNALPPKKEHSSSGCDSEGTEKKDFKVPKEEPKGKDK